MSLIKIEDLNFSYDGKIDILKNINLNIEKHQSLGLVGANGAGKSTLLKLLVGLELNYKGKIMVDELWVNKKNLREIREKTGFVFQDADSQLFMSTVYQDVAFGPRNYGYNEEEVNNRVMEALKKVHIEALADRPIYTMSGGQKKLASIATILSLKPEIILLDEPSVALDPKNRRYLITIINEMEGLKLIASHDLDFIYDTCDRVILLDEQSVVGDGTPQEILQNEKLLNDHGLELPLSFSRR